MLEAKHVTLSRGGKILLDDASFLIGKGEKVGLVGVNGAGKTTLLRALSGELDPDAGAITRPRRIGYLGQERLPDALLAGGARAAAGETVAPVTVRDVMLAGRDLGTMASALRAIEAELASATAPSPATPEASVTATGIRPHNAAGVRHDDSLEALLARYGDLEDRFQRQGGYAAEHEIVQLLRGLGLERVELDRPVAALSGGQKTRLALARVLFAAPDVLLLDEPTNHLDGPATRWLMDYLAQFAGAVLLVSHDLALLDRAIARVLHLDTLTSQITAYERPTRFTDEMVAGIFQELHHTHIFVPQPHGTLMIDIFTFRAPLGVLGRLAETLFLTRYMKGLLRARNRYLKQVAESEADPSPLAGA